MIIRNFAKAASYRQLRPRNSQGNFNKSRNGWPRQNMAPADPACHTRLFFLDECVRPKPNVAHLKRTDTLVTHLLGFPVISAFPKDSREIRV